MPRFYANAALWVTLSLLAPCLDPEQVFAADATDAPENAAPQGTDPPGADNRDEPTPPLVQKDGAIEPPPVGDQDIYTEAPDPNAGHEQEVIPPPGTPGGDPNVQPR